jgi:hypothetical protein
MHCIHHFTLQTLTAIKTDNESRQDLENALHLIPTMQSVHPSIPPFLVYAVVVMMQAWTMIRCLFFAVKTHSTTTSGVETWDLRMGCIGILILTIGTMLDNLHLS